MIMELILSIFLARKTRKNNRNTSIPSSKSEKDESTPKVTGSNSNGKLENKTTARKNRINEKVSVSHVYACDRCGEDLEKVPVKMHERLTKIDIVFEKVIDHIDAEIKRCPSAPREVSLLIIIVHYNLVMDSKCL
ncbi:MAG: hypothetical protein GY786_15255 [Proteobacteria bacterium]|nr:hypothetical protein [Pseudomonadota bacterium]